MLATSVRDDASIHLVVGVPANALLFELSLKIVVARMLALRYRRKMIGIDTELLLAAMMNIVPFRNRSNELRVEIPVPQPLDESDRQDRVFAAEPQLPHPARGLKAPVFFDEANASMGR